jgi:putative DNA primase/helicase
VLLAQEFIKDFCEQALAVEDYKDVGNAVKLSDTPNMNRMLAQAEHLCKMPVSSFDNNPTLINCTNGIVNLKTKTLFHHSKEHLHFHRANANYNPDTKCPKFLKFLDQVFEEDGEITQWIQKALGYSMMGLTTEHVFFLCHGVGRNGKSTLLETIQYVLGNYADTADFEIFLLKERDGAGPRKLEAIGNLKGRRFIIASEVNKNTKFDTVRLKQLTGGDSLKGGGLYKDAYTFQPTHTLWFACNEKPNVDEDNVAFGDRVRLIPFKRYFAENERTANLPEILKSEADGIFSWMVDGAYKYLGDGLGKTPDACLVATQEYLEENNEVARFIRHCSVKEQDAVWKRSDVINIYNDWKDGFKALSDKELCKKIQKQGITYTARNTGMVFIGRKWFAPVTVELDTE